MDWVFSGIGTEFVGIVISLIIGVLGGGAIVYRIVNKRAASQKQIAGDNSRQVQRLKSGSGDMDTVSRKSKSRVSQSQTAGSTSTQIQIGDIDDA